MTNPPRDTVAPHLTREVSDCTDAKGDVEQREYPSTAPGVSTIREDDDQVGYSTFMAAQARGYEPVCGLVD